MKNRKHPKKQRKIKTGGKEMKRTREAREHSFLFGKKIVLGIIFFLALINIGCSTTAKSDIKVKEDLETIVSDFSIPNQGQFHLDSFEITERKTDTKVDQVWASCEYSNDTIKVSVSEVLLNYELYNDGWKLVDYEFKNQSTEPLSSNITEEQAEEELVSGGYDNFEFISRDEFPEETGVDTFYYEYKEEVGRIKRSYELQVCYEFETNNWVFDTIKETKTEETIDGIVGIWKYKGDNDSDHYKNAGKVKDLYVNITSIDLMKMQIEMEYDFKDYVYDVWYEKFYSVSSNGVETFSLQVYNPSKDTISVQLDNKDFSGSLFIEPIEDTEWIGAGAGEGVLISGAGTGAIWLEKE